MTTAVATTTINRPGANGAEPQTDVFRSFFDSSGMCLASLDTRMKVTEANEAFFRQFARSSAEVCGRSFFELLHPSVKEKLEQQFSWLMEGRRTRFAERMVVTRPGKSPFTGELTGIAVHGQNGQVESVIVLVRSEKTDSDPQVLSGRKKLLTAMDARILEGVASGVSTVQLAAMLYLSRGGVEYHVSTLLRKLKVSNRPALVSKAYSIGIFAVGAWPPKVLTEYVR